MELLTVNYSNDIEWLKIKRRLWNNSEVLGWMDSREFFLLEIKETSTASLREYFSSMDTTFRMRRIIRSPTIRSLDRCLTWFRRWKSQTYRWHWTSVRRSSPTKSPQPWPKVNRSRAESKFCWPFHRSIIVDPNCDALLKIVIKIWNNTNNN